jgi:hypothetical protein
MIRPAFLKRSEIFWKKRKEKSVFVRMFAGWPNAPITFTRRICITTRRAMLMLQVLFSVATR